MQLYFPGVIFVTKKGAIVPTLETASHQDTETPNIYHINGCITALEVEDQQQITDVYVYACQGKSVHTHVWYLNTLVKSNQQLMEIGSSINLEQFVVGEEGIEEGLCGKAVLLWCD